MLPPRARDLISCTSLDAAAWQRSQMGRASSSARTSGTRCWRYRRARLADLLRSGVRRFTT